MNTIKKMSVSALILLISLSVSLFVAELVLKIQGINRYQTWLEMDDKGYIKNRANFDAFGYTFDGPTNYTFDKFRNRTTPVSGKSVHAKKVLMLGDSFQFGLYLEDSVTITHRLNSISDSSIVFINGGVGGSGTADHVWHLRNAIKENKPNVVMVLTNYDDVDRAIFKNLFILKDGQLIESQRFKPTWIYKSVHLTSWHARFEKYSYLYALISQVLWKYAFFYDDYDQITKKPLFTWPNNAELYPDNEYAINLWTALILNMKKECEEQNVQFIVGNTGYTPDSINNPRTWKVYQQWNSLMTEMNVETIDLRAVMKHEAQGDWKSLTLWPDSHPNARATAIMANEILKQYEAIK